jgi:hypothetical protein
MIEHAHPYQLQRVAQIMRDRAIGGAGLGNAGGVTRVS